MYENPNTENRSVTVVFTYASDDANDPVMRGELVASIEDLAQSLGCDYEIHTENMLADV
jgi:hypothetical protein